MAVFFTASRAYGIYDSEYHVIARNWNMHRRIVNANFFQYNPDTNVSTMKSKVAIVAIYLVSLNIFLICFHGPIKKSVLPIDEILPRV